MDAVIRSCGISAIKNIVPLSAIRMRGIDESPERNHCRNHRESVLNAEGTLPRPAQPISIASLSVKLRRVDKEEKEGIATHVGIVRLYLQAVIKIKNIAIVFVTNSPQERRGLLVIRLFASSKGVQVWPVLITCAKNIMIAPSWVMKRNIEGA